MTSDFSRRCSKIRHIVDQCCPCWRPGQQVEDWRPMAYVLGTCQGINMQSLETAEYDMGQVSGAATRCRTALPCSEPGHRQKRGSL
jgi:hypothetical protein